MPLNIQALREKLTELKGGPDRSAVLWKPKEGTNTIRIVPLASNPENPFTELYFHYLGGKTYLSPKTFGEPDPIAEFSDNLIAGGGLSKDEYREAKKFSPQIRTYLPVIDRDHPELGVRFWAFGRTVFQELVAVMTDPDYGDITDPQTGRDIKVEFTPQEKSDTKFAQTKIRISPKQSPLSKESTELEKWLTQQPDLMSIYTKLSYDELNDILTRFINGTTRSQSDSTPKVDDSWGDDAESPTSSSETPSPSAAKSRSTKETKKPADIEEEFASIFNS